MFYNGEKLLNSLDKNGKNPLIFGSVSFNRSIGKTTFFNRFLIDNFLKNCEKFVVLVRYKYELNSILTEFTKDVQELFFSDKEFFSKKHDKYTELYVKDNKSFLMGYALPINLAYELKKSSHVFNDAKWIIFDEFDNPKYCPNEYNKFLTIYKSIARGKGQKNRDVKVIFIGNALDACNPYLLHLGLSDTSNKNGIIKGDYVVFEFLNDNNTPQKTAFEMAFKTEDTGYTKRNDLGTPPPKAKYLATIEIENALFSIRVKDNICYISDKIEPNFNLKISGNIPVSKGFVSIKTCEKLRILLLTSYYNCDIIYSSITMLYYFKKFLGV